MAIVRMMQRRGTAAEWAAANPVLAEGEIGFETDTKILKLGDGSTPWNTLSPPPSGGSYTASVSADPNTVILRTAAGQARVTAPQVVDDITRMQDVLAQVQGHDESSSAHPDITGEIDTHAALTKPHGASEFAYASSLVFRDGNGRARITPPTVNDEISNKGYVDTATSGLEPHRYYQTNNTWPARNTNKRVVWVTYDETAPTPPEALVGDILEPRYPAVV